MSLGPLRTGKTFDPVENEGAFGNPKGPAQTVEIDSRFEQRSIQIED